ncbi:hypothetical protein BY458DRAFT_470117 [Sporodiniella umbellata]|nr:hypothetical protein BY458DRAFT_470117 [Sporodiniella umbellata]
MDASYIFSNNDSHQGIQSRFTMSHSQEYNNHIMPPPYVPHITTTPVVKSHNIYQHDSSLNFMESNMDIDYFDPIAAHSFSSNAVPMDTAMFNNIYSPSINSVTTNSSAVMIDTALSPVSPMNLMSPTSHIMNINSPMDTFVAPISAPYMMVADNNNNFISNPMMPPSEGFESKAKRTLPRRHTVSTPYNTNMVHNNNNTTEKGPDKPEKTRKSLKAKRHKSMGRIDICSQRDSSTTPPPPLPATKSLSLWSHEELLQRVIELEKEKVTQSTLLKGDRVTHCSTAALQNKLDKNGSTSSEEKEEDNEEEDEEVHSCQWESCVEDFVNIEELITHVKDEHIGSGKTQYYCCWKDCARQQKPFTKRHKMHNHLRIHTGERPFVCTEPDCGKKFSRPDSLTTHVKIHSNIRPYTCKYPNCDKAYYHLRSLRKHEKAHTKDDDTTVVVQSAMHPDNLFLSKQDVYSDWALSTQAAVMNILDGNGNY